MNYLKKEGAKLLKQADIKINGKRPWDMNIHNDKFFSKLLHKGSIALGESYVDGWWDCKAIDRCIFRMLRSGIIKKLNIPFIDKLRSIEATIFNLQSVSKAKKNASFHYDWGYDLFESTLDKHMNYSCGYFKNVKNLEQAQIAKMDLIGKKLKLKPGMKILDIGCGWGGIAKYIAKKHNVHVTGITPSKKQFDYAKKHNKIKNTKFLLQDYRHHKGQYDRIICIEMMSHVGYKNHRAFMEILSKNLKKDGLILLQVISSSISTKKTDPWIDKYMFPGVVLTSAKQIADAAEGLFYIQDWHNLNKDYHKTIMWWVKNFDKNYSKIKHNYDERFYRAFRWYLLCASSTVLTQGNHLYQIVFSRIDSSKDYNRVL